MAIQNSSSNYQLQKNNINQKPDDFWGRVIALILIFFMVAVVVIYSAGLSPTSGNQTSYPDKYKIHIDTSGKYVYYQQNKSSNSQKDQIQKEDNREISDNQEVVTTSSTKAGMPYCPECMQIVTKYTFTINTKGEASTEVTPDRGVIYITFMKEGTDASKISREVISAANSLIASLEQYPYLKLKTTNVNISQKKQYKDGTYIVVGYVARVDISIDAPVEEVGKLISAISAENKNDNILFINNISFYYSKINEVKNELLTKASNDARIKAYNIAKGAVSDPNPHLYVYPVEINYNFYSPTPIYRYDNALAKSSVSEESVEPLNIQPGTTKISVTVSAKFKVDVKTWEKTLVPPKPIPGPEPIPGPVPVPKP